MTWLRRKWKQLRAVVKRALSGEEPEWEHRLPQDGTYLSWSVGERCIYCLTRPDDDAWEQPCPRRRPDMTELA